MDINDISIRTDIRPGDLGFVMYRHGKLYSEEYDYSVSLETYVGLGLYEFYKNYDAEKDRVWICEHNTCIVGFLLLMHCENNAARLRFFYLDTGYRGIGLGNKLMQLFMDFLKEKGYTSCYLTTTHEQSSAAALYKKYGFELTEEMESTQFGKPLIEQRYDLKFVGSAGDVLT
jgi:ribosomal protein S18 acetylase RimI-like enzyme